VLDVRADDLDPVVPALFPHRIGRGGEPRVVERPERDCDQPVELAVDLIMDVRPALGAEMEDRAIAAVGDFTKVFDLPSIVTFALDQRA
jgi:hypothetical protein